MSEITVKWFFWFRKVSPRPTWFTGTARHLTLMKDDAIMGKC